MGFSKWLYGAGKEGIAIISKPGLPEIEPLDEKLFGKNRYRLIKTYTYKWKFKINENQYSEHKIIVPKNFIYDGASVPSLVTRLTGIRRDGEHRAAARDPRALRRASAPGKPPTGSAVEGMKLRRWRGPSPRSR